MSPSDVGLNILKVVQRMSAQAKTMPLGSYFLSVSGEVIAPDTIFAVLFRKTTYIKWIGKPGEGKIDFRTDNPNDPRILADDGLTFRKSAEGKTLPPSVTQYMNFYVVLATHPKEPMLLSFKRTFLPVGRKLTQAITRGLQNPGLPLFSLLFRLHPTKERKDENFELVFESWGWTPEKNLPNLEKLRQTALELDQYFETTAAAMEGGEGAETEEKMKTAEESPHSSPSPTPPPAQTSPPAQASPPASTPKKQEVNLWGDPAAQNERSPFPAAELPF
jgi:hypothetical protein